MIDNLVFSLNVVLPLLFLVAIGWGIGKIRFLPEDFFKYTEKFVFKIALPCNLFMSVYNAEAKEVFDGRFILFCVGAIVASFLLLCAAVPIFIKENDRRGAFIQGVFRSNFAILGVPLLMRIFPSNGSATASMIMPFAVPMFNIFAVIILSVFAPSDKKMSAKEITLVSAKGIVKNPLIIGIVLALPFMLSALILPNAVTSTVKYLGDTTTPLALMCLGVSIKKERIVGNLKLASIASALKVVVLPLIVLATAVAFGYRGVQLGVIFILFGGPTAVSSYIMAKNMKSDHELAGQILLFTTVLCAITIFLGVFILQSLGYINETSV